MKKRLTQNEEFEIMKLVLDKFLWVGTLIMLYGFYVLIKPYELGGKPLFDGILYVLAGAVVLVLFMILIVKEYEVIR